MMKRKIFLSFVFFQFFFFSVAQNIIEYKGDIYYYALKNRITESENSRTDLQKNDTIHDAYTNFIIESATLNSNKTFDGLLHYRGAIYGVDILCSYYNLKVNLENQIIDIQFNSIKDLALIDDSIPIKKILETQKEIFANWTGSQEEKDVLTKIQCRLHEQTEKLLLSEYLSDDEKEDLLNKAKACMNSYYNILNDIPCE